MEQVEMVAISEHTFLNYYHRLNLVDKGQQFHLAKLEQKEQVKQLKQAFLGIYQMLCYNKVCHLGIENMINQMNCKMVDLEDTNLMNQLGQGLNTDLFDYLTVDHRDRLFTLLNTFELLHSMMNPQDTQYSSFFHNSNKESNLGTMSKIYYQDSKLVCREDTDLILQDFEPVNWVRLHFSTSMCYDSEISQVHIQEDNDCIQEHTANLHHMLHTFIFIDCSKVFYQDIGHMKNYLDSNKVYQVDSLSEFQYQLFIYDKYQSLDHKLIPGRSFYEYTIPLLNCKCSYQDIPNNFEFISYNKEFIQDI